VTQSLFCSAGGGCCLFLLSTLFLYVPGILLCLWNSHALLLLVSATCGLPGGLCLGVIPPRCAGRRLFSPVPVENTTSGPVAGGGACLFCGPLYLFVLSILLGFPPCLPPLPLPCCPLFCSRSVCCLLPGHGPFDTCFCFHFLL
jgi:hypothetical protein